MASTARFTTRVAVQDDVVTITEIGNEAFLADAEYKHPGKEQRYRAADVAANFGETNVVLLVAEVDGSVAGSIRLNWRWEEGALIGNFGGVAVGASFGRRGIGSGLVAAAEQHLLGVVQGDEEVRMEMVVLGCRADLFPWYEKQHYRKTGASFRCGPEDAMPEIWNTTFDAHWMGKILRKSGENSAADSDSDDLFGLQAAVDRLDDTEEEEEEEDDQPKPQLRPKVEFEWANPEASSTLPPLAMFTPVTAACGCCSERRAVKVLFLDIDGVLNHDASTAVFEPELVARVLKLLDCDESIGICISSARRHDPKLPGQLSEAGFDVMNKVIGCTRKGNVVDENQAAAHRVEEIEAWLKDAPAQGYSVQGWCSVDDLELPFPGAVASHFVHVDPSRGLSEAGAAAAASALGLGL